MKNETFVAPVTQRAYTLRLDGLGLRVLEKLPENERETAKQWRDALWRTHEAVNKGACAFGDWLLTMRGGLSHELAERPLVKGKKPSPEDVRNRRALLALSWLSVESQVGSPREFRIGEGPGGGKRPMQALMDILEKRKVKGSEREAWAKDCESSLGAAIRDDAVWVDRSACFDALRQELGDSLTRDEAERTVFEMLDPAEVYFHLEVGEGEDDAEVALPSDGPKSSNAGRGWLSFQWGKGEKSDNTAIASSLKRLAKADLSDAIGQSGKSALQVIARKMGIKGDVEDTTEAIRLQVGWKTGRPSKGRMALDKLAAMSRVSKAAIEEFSVKISQEAEEKGGGKARQVMEWAAALRRKVEKTVGFPFDMERDLIGEYSVMLDHALRRVSGGHSWIKNAEEERLVFEKDAHRGESVPPGAQDWLNRFCVERSRTSGALEPYRIRRRALGGWKELVGVWKKLADEDVQGRIEAARALQDQLEDEKFGDIELFTRLADTEALVVWRREGKADPQPLLDYAAASDALAKQKRFKVPAYRHPDALRHPVFCDFGNSRWNVDYRVHESANKGVIPEDGELRRLKLGLWDGKRLAPVPMRWRSKKIFNDLNLEQEALKGKAVTRADRLGRAAAGISGQEETKILSLFEEKEWNGRLQVSRRQLEVLAEEVEAAGGAWSEKAIRLRERLGWLVSFTAKLQPQGPWFEYVNEQGLKVSKRNGWPIVDGNKSRGRRSKLGLCRLPDLRVLSVDLGHRYAAACAVWQVVSQRDLEKACETAGVKIPEAGALSHSIQKKGKSHFLFRRIGMDGIKVDESTGEEFARAKAHPGPWARLDRQFLIKLQGEDGPARYATPEELSRMNALEQALGRTRKEARKGEARRVDALQTEAVDLCRMSLRLHADAARIAFNLTAQVRFLPGGREEALTAASRAELLADTLALWRSRFGSGRWQDTWARQTWERHIGPHLKEVVLEDGGEDEGGKDRKKRQDQWRHALLPLAQAWVTRDLKPLGAAWNARWIQEDAEWRKRLRWIRDWMLPSGAQGDSKLIRNVGGLSLRRIAALKSLYQVQKAYAMRPEPEHPRKNVPKDGDDSLVGYAQGVLTAMGRLRENRVKQLASRLAAAALGLDKDLKPRADDSRYAACQAIVVEDLEHYRPEEVRTRRENRQLMDWSSAKVLKYLKEACELNGLHLRQVQPAYTSRQDSRTGAPGMRCQDVQATEFLGEPGFWAARVQRARGSKSPDAYERFLVDLWDTWKGKNPKAWERKLFRLPVRGGELFVSSDRNSSVAKGLQADLNAAANIGLKALLDPDWPGAWWYVPCEGQPDGSWRPVKKDIQGGLCPELGDPLIRVKDVDGAKVKRAKRAESEKPRPMNLWRDASSEPLRPGPWKFYQVYWSAVEERILDVLRHHNGMVKV